MSQGEETKSARIAEYRWRIDKAQGCSEVWEIVKDFEKSTRKYIV